MWGRKSVCFKNRIYNHASAHSAVGFSGPGNSSVVLADGVQKTTQGGRTLAPPGGVPPPPVHNPHPATGRASPRLSLIVIDSFMYNIVTVGRLTAMEDDAQELLKRRGKCAPCSLAPTSRLPDLPDICDTSL